MPDCVHMWIYGNLLSMAEISEYPQDELRKKETNMCLLYTYLYVYDTYTYCIIFTP